MAEALALQCVIYVLRPCSLQRHQNDGTSLPRITRVRSRSRSVCIVMSSLLVLTPFSSHHPPASCAADVQCSHKFVEAVALACRWMVVVSLQPDIRKWLADELSSCCTRYQGGQRV